MLQGTLNDFSLPDVFSLLALTKKSGALRVAKDHTDGRVYFRDGAICLALSDAKRVPLVARLVSAGLVDEAQLRAMVDEHSGSSLAVTEALLTSGQVEDRVLGALLREQIVDAVFELMRLQEGDFSFDASEPGLSRGVALSVVEVVGEASRRLEEWQTISSRIASRHAVLAMVPAGADTREGITLANEQWDLLALIDGRRTVSEVVELTGKGEFATCRVLGDLVDAGLVEAQDPATGGQTRLAALIAAREALHSLEQVEKQSGIRPKLSSAAPLSAGGSAVRWIEPTKEDKAEKAKPVALAPRTRTQEDALTVTEPPAVAAEAAVDIPTDAPADDTASPVELVSASPSAPIDRAQVARELASLGLEDLSDIRPDPERSNGRLTRDEDVNKGLLLRLIDGVKGA